MSKYTVQSGDTLTKIALSHGLCKKGAGNTLKDWQPCINIANEIALNSGLKDMNQIRPGQVLDLPDPQRAAVVAAGPAAPWSPTSAPPVAVASTGGGKGIAIAAAVIGAGVVLAPKIKESMSGLAGALFGTHSRRRR